MSLQSISISYENLQNSTIHKHDTWEIVLNLSGYGTNFYQDEKTDFYPGFISVCPPNTYHGKKSTDGYFQDIYLTFSENYQIKNLDNYYFKDDEERTIEKLMFIIHNAYHSKCTNYQNITESLLDAICNILISWDKTKMYSYWVEILVNDIIKNFTNPDYKVEQTLSSMNYCNDYIRRCFKKETKLTPTKFLNSLRIEHSKRLLLTNNNPPRSINDIAYMSGFYDARYFSRVFKSFVGCSPKELIIKASK